MDLLLLSISVSILLQVSDAWDRCCCKPYHPLRLEARQYLPVPGDGAVSDYSHLSADFQKVVTKRIIIDQTPLIYVFVQEFRDLSGVKKAKALRELYSSQPVLFSLVRDDGMRCW